MHANRHSFRHSIHNTLFFFPALLPLASVLPWLLTLVGTLAGLVQKFKISGNKLLKWLMISCFLVAAVGFIWIFFNKPDSNSRLTPADKLPRLETNKIALQSSPVFQSQVDFSKLKETWSILSAKRLFSNLAASKDLLLVGSQEGTVDALSTLTGQTIWTIHKSQPILAAAAITKTRAYLGEGLHTSITSALTAVSLPDGRPIWQREFLGHIETPPAVLENQNQLWLGTGPSGLWSLNSTNGKVIWRKNLGHVDSTPLLIQDSMIVPAQKDEKVLETTLFSLSPQDGQEKWSRKVPGQPWGTPLLALNQILFTTGIGQIGLQQESDRGWSHSADLNGNILWSTELSGMPLPKSSVWEEKHMVFHTLKNGELIALNIFNGKTVWSKKLGDEFRASAELVLESAQPVIIALLFDGKLSIRNALTGEEFQQLDGGPASTSSPTFSNGRLFITSPSGISAYQGVH